MRRAVRRADGAAAVARPLAASIANDTASAIVRREDADWLGGRGWRWFAWRAPLHQDLHVCRMGNAVMTTAMEYFLVFPQMGGRFSFLPFTAA